MDNDVYGHVNNVQYYSYFDTAVNRYMIERGGLDIRTGETIGLVVETGCSYRRPIAFPDAVERSEEHTSELQSLMRISYAVFCLKKKRSDESNTNSNCINTIINRLKTNPDNNR